MSIYAVHKVLHRVQVDLDFRELVRTAPSTAIADFALSVDERTAFVTGDVAALARAGVHTFLLSRIPRFGLIGLDRDEYNGRMRALLDDQAP